MPKTINPPLQENKKPFHQRNSSDEINVFEASRYFEDTNTTLSHKNYMRESVGRLSLDIQNNRRNSNNIPLQAMMMENGRNSIPLKAMMMDPNHMMIKNEKKYKQPSSPGGKLAHFLNSLFNQTSSKKSKSKSKSTTSTQSIKDEDESPSGWRRKRRSSISLFRSGNSNTSNIASETKPANYSTTPHAYDDHMPQAPTKRTSYKDLRSYSDHKPTYEVTKVPFNENYNKNENLKIKSGFSDRKSRSPENVSVEKVRVCDVKHDDHNQKYDPTVEIREFKRFILDDDGDSDSSSDLFELTNCDLGYYSSGLPVFETTHMDSIKRGTPISS
ncbi:protein BIG GRAIN 1-like E [Lactuca sativa]|uniref:protein BIG GRAIN 1-like E n=1 Tax=Lactuca sativa TaxID=4236 RepID=UPI000CC919E9|nr:protein BIG GRAIN 1-like E [Lactuca sativa]